jgi:AraC-like DNA-binding protein
MPATDQRWNRFDSRQVADGWRAALETRIINVDVRPLSDGPLHAAIDLADLGGISVVAFDMSPVVMARTGRHVTDGYDGFALSVATGPSLGARQAGDDFTISPGEAVLMDARLPSELAGPEAMNFLGFRISRNWFERFSLALPESGRKLRASAPLDMLVAYASRIAGNPALQSEGLARMIESHVSDLLAASMIAGGNIATHDAAALADLRYRCISEGLRARASQPGLTLPSFARSIGVSERGIQATLSRCGTTFSDLLRRFRLEIAQAHLRRGDRSVAAVAFASGFQDLSTFNRAFRTAYGLTPRDIAVRSPRPRIRYAKGVPLS